MKKYRMLKDGETIKKEDEFLNDDKRWERIGGNNDQNQWPINGIYNSKFFVPMRRAESRKIAEVMYNDFVDVMKRDFGGFRIVRTPTTDTLDRFAELNEWFDYKGLLCAMMREYVTNEEPYDYRE